MKQKLRFGLLTAAVLMIFVLSAVWTAPASADDEVPPPTETPITETDPTPPAPETVAEPAADSAPDEEPAPVTELLEQLPEGTTVVVTDSEGEPLPLATDEAAHAIVENDPMWCPAGVTPGGAGCTLSYDSMASLITELNTAGGLVTNPAKAGVIWIEGSYQSGNVLNDPGVTSFTLDGLILTNMAKYALTIQGGWTGSGKTIDQFNPSEFNASLSILNWLAPITINDILVTGATVNPNPGTNGALQVETTKSIILNRVQSSENNNLWGAVLDNGIGNSSISPIIINDSTFNGNSGDGLHVFSIGAITVRNVTANFNGIDDANLEYGAFLTNFGFGPDTNQPVTLNGTNEFKGNLGTGLFVSSYGIVTLNNITATGNDDGTDSVNNDAQGVLVDASLSVKMTGTNLINYNQTNGLDISSDGTISLNNINASNNGDNGALLDNCLNPANTVCPTVAKAVTLTGYNTFNWNGNYGLHVESSGVIKVSQVTATHNTTGGVFLDNCAYHLVNLVCLTPLPYTVTITSPSTFLYNGFDGLYIRTTGAVSLKSITSSFNDNRGVNIENRGSLLKPQNVTLSGINVINGNDNTGLRILSYGAVSIASLTASDNGQTDSSGYGVFVDNRAYNGTLVGSVLVSRKPVTFTGNNTLNNNYTCGLFIYSVGDVTLSNIIASNVTAVGNGTAGTGDGVYIENQVDWYPNGVTKTAYAANVTLNGFGIFEGNGDEGLQIISRGTVKLNNVTASNNSDVGVYVDNRIVSTITVRQPITLIGTNTFNNNSGGGLMLYSFGAIALSNVTANGNLPTGGTGIGLGVYIDNDEIWNPGVLTNVSYAANVTLSGFGYFEGNTDDGLQIFSRGAVTLSNLTANSNGDNGVYVNTVGDLLPQNVTLNGVNNFYGNGFTSTTGNGLFIQSDGKITINNLSAIGNRAYGAWLDNFNDKKPNKFLGVTLTGFNSFQKNQGTNGLFIYTDGSVLLYHVTADDNSGNGINVVATKNITISCGSAFSNFGTGFFLNAGAILTLKGVHAYGNGADEILNPLTPIRTFACP